MTKRKGVFIGAYIAPELKDELQRRAKAEHRTLSQQITKILTEALRGNHIVSAQDRRAPDSTPRRRATDPGPRRRATDIPGVIRS